MKLKLSFICIFMILGCTVIWAGGSSESATSDTYGKYLAGQGIIIPAEDVYIDTYIAKIDYKYPIPVDDLGITLYSGHRQVSAFGQEEVIQIGIQGGRREFEDLPPMNLAFVIDKSGSMSGQDKMNWVKDAFAIFVDKVRDIDFVSLIVFDSEATVVFPSTQMNTMNNRLEFKNAVQSIIPGGGTNLVAGLELGYLQVQSNFRKDYTNRVLFLTDGVGDSVGILEMAEVFKEQGINVSTIGVGSNFDLELMTNLAKSGGGSSRFISDREEMEKTFGSELDRMVVPVARNLDMTLEFLQDVEIIDTWGYRNEITGNKIHYFLPTLHHRDYETILVHIRIPETDLRGDTPLCKFNITYNDLYDIEYNPSPYTLNVEFVEINNPVSGFSDSMVLQSGSMMHFAKNLIWIADFYYSSQDDINSINIKRQALWQNNQQAIYEELTSPEIEELEASVFSRIQMAMDIVINSKKEINNARLRLDNEGFEDEIWILDEYIKILGIELEMNEQNVNEIAADLEIIPDVQDRNLHEQLDNLFREMILELQEKENGIIAISGFTASSGEDYDLLNLLNEMAILKISGIDTLSIVERSRLDTVLDEQVLSLSDLTDTSTAIKIGMILTADYIVTGSVIEMSSSVIIFGRIINVETGEIESVAQVILPKDSELASLL